MERSGPPTLESLFQEGLEVAQDAIATSTRKQVKLRSNKKH